jgi:hypothetical protein
MDKRPFDGLMIMVTRTLAPRQGGSQDVLGWQAFGTNRFIPADYEHAIEDLQATVLTNLTEKFIAVVTMPGVDLFDPYDAVVHNLGVLARVAKQGGCTGLMLDAEQYDNSNWTYRGLPLEKRQLYTQAQYAAQAMLRGGEVMRAINAEFPDIRILLLFGPSLSVQQTKSYDLLLPFIEGMCRAATPATLLYDGYEQSYSFRTEAAFQQGRTCMVQDARELFIDKDAFDQHMRAGFGLWLDNGSDRGLWYPNDPSRNYFTPTLWQSTMHHALSWSDRYVWVYNQRVNWWTTPPTGLAPAYEEAQRRALDGPAAAAVHVALSGDGSTGASWTAAYTNIQTAINDPYALNGVWIKAGTYAVTGQILMTNNMALYGGFAGTEFFLDQRDWRANATIITNSAVANDSAMVKRVINCDGKSNWRLDGLQITGGSLYSASFNSGADNRGAGVSMNGGGGSNVIANCRIAGNRGLGASGGYSVGLGMRLGDSTSFYLIENTILDDNVSANISAHAYIANGNGATVVFRNCVFRRGKTPYYGSGIGKDAGAAKLRVENCVFIDNGKSGDRSQAIEVSAGGTGSTVVYNCVFADHTNGTAAAILEITSDANLDMFNNVFYNNAALYKDNAATVLTTAAALNALPEADGNQVADPRFLDKVRMDYRVPAASPCVDTGTNYLGLAVRTDTYGNPRPVNIVNVGGEGAANTHDVGIYELPVGVDHALHVARSGNGSSATSWATAFTNIQSAINDTRSQSLAIWIKADVYAVNSPIVLKDSVTLYGGFAGTETGLAQRDWRANATIITNTVDADAAVPVRRVFQGDYKKNWRVDGLHITGGSLYSAVFNGNAVNQGAGLSANYCSGSNVVANCRVASNRGLGAAGAYSAGLGLIYMDGTLTIENTILDNNTTPSICGHAYILSGTASVVFRNCVFRRGQSNYGSGVGKSSNGSLRIENCAFINNGRVGGRCQALEVSTGGGTSLVYNSVFMDHNNGTGSTILEITGDTNLELYNNLFHDNWAIYEDDEATLISTAAALNALPEACGNREGDPGFLDKAQLDLRVGRSSPCVDNGINLLGLAPRTDFYGNPRPVDAIDIGIFELPLPLIGTVFLAR